MTNNAKKCKVSDNFVTNPVQEHDCNFRGTYLGLGPDSAADSTGINAVSFVKVIAFGYDCLASEVVLNPISQDEYREITLTTKIHSETAPKYREVDCRRRDYYTLSFKDAADETISWMSVSNDLEDINFAVDNAAVVKYPSGVVV